MHDLNLENVVKEPTCCKPDNPTCIDLILTSDTRKLSNVKQLNLGYRIFMQWWPPC